MREDTRREGARREEKGHGGEESEGRRENEGESSRGGRRGGDERNWSGVAKQQKSSTHALAEVTLRVQT